MPLSHYVYIIEPQKFKFLRQDRTTGGLQASTEIRQQKSDTCSTIWKSNQSQIPHSTFDLWKCDRWLHLYLTHIFITCWNSTFKFLRQNLTHALCQQKYLNKNATHPPSGIAIKDEVTFHIRQFVKMIMYCFTADSFVALFAIPLYTRVYCLSHEKEVKYINELLRRSVLAHSPKPQIQPHSHRAGPGRARAAVDQCSTDVYLHTACPIP